MLPRTKCLEKTILIKKNNFILFTVSLFLALNTKTSHIHTRLTTADMDMCVCPIHVLEDTCIQLTQVWMYPRLYWTYQLRLTASIHLQNTAEICQLEPLSPGIIAEIRNEIENQIAFLIPITGIGTFDENKIFIDLCQILCTPQ